MAPITSATDCGLPKGVRMRKSSGKGIRKRRMIKPYRTSIDGRNRYFATVEEAVDFLGALFRA